MSIYLGARKILTQTKSTVDTKNFLKKDGSISMAGNFDMGNYAIDNLKSYPENNKNATSKKYVDDECNKLLDLGANRPLTGDLNLNNNAIIGIQDINADNSVPSKKFVKDENSKQNTKITQNENQAHLNANRNLSMTNEINTLKAQPLYSHYFSFFYQNPVANVYKGPHTAPAGFPFDFLWLTPDYNENTTLTLLGLNTDDDSTLPTTNVNFSVWKPFVIPHLVDTIRKYFCREKIFTHFALLAKMNFLLKVQILSHSPSKISTTIGVIGTNSI